MVPHLMSPSKDSYRARAAEVRPPENRSQFKSRSMVSNAALKAPFALTTTLVFGTLAWAAAESNAPEMWVIVAGTLAVTSSALLMLFVFRSAANLELAERRAEARALLATARRAYGHLDSTADLVSQLGMRFSDTSDAMRAVELMQHVLEAGHAELSESGVERPRLAVVKFESDRYLVIDAAGFAPDGIQPGKSCSNERPLNDVLTELAAVHYRVPFTIDGQPYALAALGASEFTDEDLVYIRALASSMSLASGLAIRTLEAASTSPPES